MEGQETFHFKTRWLATLKFTDVLTENKKREHLRGSASGETAKKKKDWKKMEGKWRDALSLWELKTGRLVLTDKI